VSAPAVPDGQERRETALAILLLAALALGHLGVRVAISGTAELDEAEQLVLTQTWALGYDDQPPLYTWLQALAFAALGVGIPALALVKNALLFGTHLFVFLSARLALGRGWPALATSLALYLLPQIAWESRRDLSNSVLATALAAATFHLVLGIRASATPSRYLVLGALLAAGLLSRYTFGIFAVALLAAVAWTCAPPPGARRRLLLALGLAAALVAPHGLWLVMVGPADPWELAEKLGLGGAGEPVETAVRGLGALAWAAVRFLAPLAAAAVVCWPRALASLRQTPAHARVRRLLERFFGVAFVLMAAGVLALGMTRFKDRWLQPVLVLAPLYLMSRVLAAGGPARRTRLFTGLALVAAVATLLAPAAQIGAGPRLGQHSRLHVPFAGLAAEIRRAGFSDGTILAGDVFLAGNLRLWFPRARLLTPELPRAGVGEGRPLLVVWRSGGPDGAPPAKLERLAARVTGAPLPPADGAPRRAGAPLAGPDRRGYQIEFLVLPPPRAPGTTGPPPA
jgi:4-amino-4-deoxy-L-arabinose transferase-like glycosyltransferase